jgi:hypothetical protein
VTVAVVGFFWYTHGVRIRKINGITLNKNKRKIENNRAKDYVQR